METMTPEQFLAILAIGIGVTASVVAWQLRLEIAQFSARVQSGVRRFFPAPDHSVKSHRAETGVSPARTGAAAANDRAPHWDAGAVPVRGAVRGAEPAIPAGSLLLSAEELTAAAAMVRHKVSGTGCEKT